MLPLYSFCENQLKMVKGMIAKRDYYRARQICVDVINQLREPMLQDTDKTDSIQLIAISAGEISETYEKENNLSDALKFKVLQRELLNYVKVYESMAEDIEEDIPENGNLSLSRTQLFNIIDETFKIESQLKIDDPQEAMKQILASMERAKEQKVKDAIEAICEANRNLPKKYKIESFFELVLDHPLIFAFVIIIMLSAAVVCISNFLKPSVVISPENQNRIKDMTIMMQQYQKEYNRKIKNMKDL